MTQTDAAQALLAVILARAIEHGMLILVGTFAIYLGYRLFHLTPQVQESGMELKTARITIALSRIGPGVFFALFGCGVVGYSASRPVEFRLNDDPALATGRASVPGAADPAVVVARLNVILKSVSPGMSAAAEARDAIQAAKLAVMLRS